MRTIQCLVLLLLVTAAFAEGVVARSPEQIDKDLDRFTEALGKGGLSGYQWPEQITSVGFTTTAAEDGLESIAVITCTGEDESTFNRSLLVVGEAYGCLFHQGVTMKTAMVVFKTPEGSSLVILPMKECADLGQALLADPQDVEKIKDAMFHYATSVVRLSK